MTAAERRCRASAAGARRVVDKRDSRAPLRASIALGIGLGACAIGDAPAPNVESLHGVRSWAIQLQSVETPRSIAAIVSAPVDLLVLEPTRSVVGSEDVPMARIVRRVHEVAPGRRCVAYLNVGQAEDYRTYWSRSWRVPAGDRPGEPSFLVAVDPDGWAGNYPVAFWDSRWRDVLFGHDDALLDQILADGFDGAYVDWILGYSEPTVVAAAARDGIDPARAMVELVGELRAYARARNPRFVLIAQNGVALAEARPELLDVVDAISQEDLSFAGAATDDWDDPTAGDIAAPPTGPWSTAELGRRLRAAAERGVPVFTVDYAVRPENIERAWRTSRDLGFVPYVARTPLDRLAFRR